MFIAGCQINIYDFLVKFDIECSFFLVCKLIFYQKIQTKLPMDSCGKTLDADYEYLRPIEQIKKIHTTLTLVLKGYAINYYTKKMVKSSIDSLFAKVRGDNFIRFYSIRFDSIGFR